MSLASLTFPPAVIRLHLQSPLKLCQLLEVHAYSTLTQRPLAAHLHHSESGLMSCRTVAAYHTFTDPLVPPDAERMAKQNAIHSEFWLICSKYQHKFQLLVMNSKNIFSVALSSFHTSAIIKTEATEINSIKNCKNIFLSFLGFYHLLNFAWFIVLGSCGSAEPRGTTRTHQDATFNKLRMFF